MTPAARIAAAAQILDHILDGEPAEKALTGWARRSRFAGSGDRAAIRDHVFDALRCRRSLTALGAPNGIETGRALVIGLLRSQGTDPADLLDGGGYGLSPLTDPELAHCAIQVPAHPARDASDVDLPDWLWPLFETSLGAMAVETAMLLRARAPVFLRINLRKTERDQAILALAKDGVTAQPHPLIDTALEVTDGPRKIRNATAYLDGLVELQDAASQAVTAALDIKKGDKILDYCAGGGGKTLAMAGRVDAEYYAYDRDQGRLKDLPARARRASVDVQLLETPHGQFDLVLCDAPCSGSGSWRRAPEGKWNLTPDRLAELTQIQGHILETACDLVAPGGTLAYATCSLLQVENRDVVDAFLKSHPDWRLKGDTQWVPQQGGDGFYLAQLTQTRTTA